MLQAQNTLKTFAESTGGKYFPVTFAGEIPSVLQSVSALVRNQYSLGYTPTNSRQEGKRLLPRPDRQLRAAEPGPVGRDARRHVR